MEFLPTTAAQPANSTLHTPTIKAFKTLKTSYIYINIPMSLN